MYLYVFDLSSNDFFEKASHLETSCPDGEWRYFNFSSTQSVQALYQSDKKVAGFATLSPHEDFFNYFLGLFSPELSDNIKIESFSDFESFCMILNDHLKRQNKVLDLSNKNFWIWVEDKNGIKLPQKLKDYLS